MTITVIGLGLIGGSLCKAVKAYTGHICYGVNRSEGALRQALEDGAIDAAFPAEQLPASDLYIVCLHPTATVDFLLQHAGDFRTGSLVLDVCGVKAAVVDAAQPVLEAHGVRFLGAHPMAGREFSGYAYAKAELFHGASLVLTPPDGRENEDTRAIRRLADSLGFHRVVLTTPQEHDRIIAFTSQMAHIVANAYVKTPTLERHGGFTGGSFQDMTRVARLNAGMWSELFLLNRAPLVAELDTLLENLAAYRDALAADDGDTLRALLQAGSDRKIKSMLPEDATLRAL